MKEWVCLCLNHHNKIADEIMKMEKGGWILHTYTTGVSGTFANHYLLFYRELKKK